MTDQTLGRPIEILPLEDSPGDVRAIEHFWLTVVILPPNEAG